MKPKGGGDCYQINEIFVVDKIGEIDEKQYKLCHGVAILITDNLPFGHCWIEYGNDIVMDYSNGHKFVGRKEDYYKVGRIPAKGWPKIFKYSPREVAEKMLKYKKHGPWDYEPPR